MAERRSVRAKVLELPELKSAGTTVNVSEPRKGKARIIDITSYRLMKEENAKRDRRIEDLFGENPILDLEAYRINRHNAISTRFLYSTTHLVQDFSRAANYLAVTHDIELKNA